MFFFSKTNILASLPAKVAPARYMPTKRTSPGGIEEPWRVP
jgi:hypothetical protein